MSLSHIRKSSHTETCGQWTACGSRSTMKCLRRPKAPKANICSLWTQGRDNLLKPPRYTHPSLMRGSVTLIAQMCHTQPLWTRYHGSPLAPSRRSNSARPLNPSKTGLICFQQVISSPDDASINCIETSIKGYIAIAIGMNVQHHRQVLIVIPGYCFCSFLIGSFISMTHSSLRGSLIQAISIHMEPVAPMFPSIPSGYFFSCLP